MVGTAYAARDMLDFERRPRSNTVETTNMTEVSKSTQAAGTSNRHPGIQPGLYANPDVKAQKDQEVRDPTHLTSSSNTVVAQQEGQDGTSHAAQGTMQSQAGAERPGLPMRSLSGDPSRWLSFTLPTKYRKRLDDYMAGRAPEHEPAHTPRASSSDSERESSADEYHRHYFGRNRKKRGETSRQNSGDMEEESAVEGDQRRRRPRKPRRKKESKPQGDAEAGGGEGLAMSMRARIPDGMPISVNMADTPGWNSPWAPHQPTERQNGGPGPVGVSRFDTIRSETASMSKKKRIKTRTEKFQHWLVRSAFAPLFFRILNLAFTASILGIAIVSS